MIRTSNVYCGGILRGAPGIKGRPHCQGGLFCSCPHPRVGTFYICPHLVSLSELTSRKDWEPSVIVYKYIINESAVSRSF